MPSRRAAPGATPRQISAGRKSLRRKSPENGNISNIGRRLSADSRVSCSFLESGDVSQNARKPPILRAFCDLGAHSLTLSEWLAGDGVQIAPVSSQIPCEQGILQGISAFLAF